MRVLILGGTQMIGRDFVERYMNFHSIVLANRGITAPDIFLDLEHIKIDRNVLANSYDYGGIGCRGLGFIGEVDAVIDFSCYTVDHLKNLVPFLPNFNQYIFVSTTSVYDKNVFIQPNPSDSYYQYCVNKFECESWVRLNIKNSKIIRPCAVIGPHEYTGRFFKKNGEYFWKSTGKSASSDTIKVEKVSKTINDMLFNDSLIEIDLYP